MSKAISLFIILLLIMFAFLFLRDFKTMESSDKPVVKETNSSLQVTGNSQSNESLESPALSNNIHNWREFTSVKKNFKVFLPTLPQHLADKVPDPATGEMRKYETYLAAGDNNTAFMVNTISLTNKLDLKNAEETLRNVISEIISRNKENKLEGSKVGKFREYPALDFTIKGQDNSVTGKVFTDGNTVYILSMIADPAKQNPEEMDFFVNSFELLDKNK